MPKEDDPLNRMLSSSWINVTGAVVFAVVGVITIVVGSQLKDVAIQLAGWGLLIFSTILVVLGFRSGTFRAGGREHGA